MSKTPGLDHRLERMTFFSDAVFAISITLLVLELRLPVGADLTSTHGWSAAFGEMGWHFATFLLSFFVIGSLWVSHHALFAMLGRFSRRWLWPNLLFLLAVVFIPFTTTLLAKGSLSPVPYAVYSGSLLLAGLLKAWLTGVALAGELHPQNPQRFPVVRELRRRWVLPVAALLALALAGFAPAWNNLAMLLVPVALRLPGLAYPREGG